ncbi:hypothetical protein [Streptomyces sp. NBC_00829]|uniref:hypothetical protein n=1 Tax=Streptomyces sp. NBC_00829 TaxID=2903679 RepID=UPI003862F7B1|nr:hypothetical protein OG293_23185 [Streptomyces sp. NBC_00829]
MSNLADAATLRRLADALDRMTETTAQTGVSLSPYSSEHIEIDGITLQLGTVSEGDAVRYAVDLSSG